MLQLLSESNGTAVRITEDEMILSLQELGKLEGLFVAPEGAALCIAARKLLTSGYILPEEQVLLLNTGSGHKYMDNIKKST